VDNVTAVIPFKRGGNQEWLKEAIGSLPAGVRYLVAENDGELAEALNAALAAVTTEFVFRLDADDQLDPQSLPILESAAWDADVTYPTLVFCFENMDVFEVRKAGAFCPNRLLVENYISGCALFRPEVALAAGGYRDLEILEDWDLWVRMMRNGARFKAVPKRVCCTAGMANRETPVPPRRSPKSKRG
jgi:glycosyltransferase involved in cell wall biosynthesis